MGEGTNLGGDGGGLFAAGTSYGADTNFTTLGD
jgi:hypothetical protein